MDSFQAQVFVILVFPQNDRIRFFQIAIIYGEWKINTLVSPTLRADQDVGEDTQSDEPSIWMTIL